MPLYRQTGAKEALDALHAADRSARRRRLEAEAEIVTEKEKKETEDYAKKHGIKSSQDWIDHIRKKLLKKHDTGHLLAPLSRNGVFRTNLQPEVPKKKEPKKQTAPADHHTCKCGSPMVREILSDTATKVKKFVAWSDWVKCTRTHCDERQYKPLNQEVTT